ncbi:RDD family protein (plasmid) [Pedobacter sp. BS3]|uniref:RDD family protein n=1 Tax=Pedobacter sp. BS3 TaxID=2567937 RepID=UPI0011ED173B|nr:RDD family protein [Pedobacter sp. BS3]TZF85667.1 RDD family protein [Pedobacter sp. BS3]
METVRIQTAQNIDIDYEIAGLGERIAARLIDFGLFVAVYLIAAFVIALSSPTLLTGGKEYIWVALIVIYLVLFVFYDLICELFMNGQSIGKRLLKIKVISLDGAQPTLGQYLLRWLFRMVDFTLSAQLGGLIAVAVSAKKQRIGDMVAGTTLIKTTLRTQLEQLAFTGLEANYEPVFRQADLLSDHDIELINEVLNNFVKTRNNILVYNTAMKVKDVLGISIPREMNELEFLQTVIKDYTYLTAGEDE